MMRFPVKLSEIKKGEFFTIPGSETVWLKLDRKAERRGMSWSYWCFDGSVKKLISCRRKVFTRHKIEE